MTGDGSPPPAPRGGSGIRVLVASRQDLTRAGLRAVMATDDRLDVVAEVASIAEAIVAGRQSRVDVVVVADGSLSAAADAVGQVAASLAGPSIVVLVDDVGSDGLLAVIRSGAAGVIGRDEPADAITATIRATAEGRLSVPPDLAMSVLRDVAGGPRRVARAPFLTAREREVLALVARGRTNREIALALAVSVGTVKAHVEHILAKLGASHRTDAAIRALRMGLIDDGAAPADPAVRRDDPGPMDGPGPNGGSTAVDARGDPEPAHGEADHRPIDRWPPGR